ncbi:hypothetical protein KCP70_17060 [Salmonella enterica subsp. enterica]|nr:hypothetical protein KCP70_17060 [Salmonella enterica subsp. enterica]
MEATAIAHVRYNFNVPFVVVRAISDVADQQRTSALTNSSRRRRNSRLYGRNAGTETGALLPKCSGAGRPAAYAPGVAFCCCAARH